MISFFRRALSSWLVLGLLGLIMIAFVVTGVGTPSSLGDLAGGGSRVAKVGSIRVEANDVARRVQSQIDNARAQNPGADMAGFIREGGVEKVIDQMVNSLALEQFGLSTGMAVSERLIDGEIASIPAFRGPTGSFDRNTFLAALSQQRMTEKQLREDFARDRMTNALIVPAAGAARIPAGLALPYASLLLESRTGLIATVPIAAIPAAAPPTDAELTLFHKRQIARYTTPETRVIRYATFDRTRFEGKVSATEAEIAQAYKAESAKYAAKETRIFTQVVVQTEAAAKAIAAQARSGTSLAAAAKANGNEATTLAAQDEPAYSSLTSSSAIAKAAFQAAQGTVLDPQKSPLGWLVIRVDSIERTGGKSLADVRATLSGAIVKQKTDLALADFVTKIEDEIADGSTFDDVVKAEGLAILTLPPLTAAGSAPESPGFALKADLQPVLRDAFQADVNDDATVLALTAGQSYAFYDLDRVEPAAPKPFAAVRAQVVADFERDRASRAAKRIADAIAAKAGKGASLQNAMAGAGVSLPAPQQMGARRIDLVKSQQKVPPPLVLLFSIAPRQAKVLEAADKSGWQVIWLDRIVPGNVAREPGILQMAQAELTSGAGEEYAQQFVAAVKADIGVTRNDAAIAALKRSLAGTPASQ